MYRNPVPLGTLHIYLHIHAHLIVETSFNYQIQSLPDQWYYALNDLRQADF